MTNFLAQLLQPPPPTPTAGKLFSGSQPSNSLPLRQMTSEEATAFRAGQQGISASQKMTPDEEAAYNSGLLFSQQDGLINPNAAAQQAEQASLLAQNATSDPDLADAYRAIQAGKYDQWQQQQQQQSADFWESGLGNWLQTNPAIAYAQSVNSQLLATKDMGEGQPPKQPGIQEKGMAALVNVGAFGELFYNTPVGGYTNAQLISKSFENDMYQTEMLSGLVQYLWNPQEAFERQTAATQARGAMVEDMQLAAAMTNPDYWGMTPEQAEKFAAAPRGHVGMEQPWFTPLMLPNPDGPWQLRQRPG